jgi:hypothetical protein
LENKKNTLPLDFSKPLKLLVIGQDDIVNTPITGRQGSEEIIASYVKTPVNEAADRLGVEQFVPIAEGADPP